MPPKIDLRNLTRVIVSWLSLALVMPVGSTNATPNFSSIRIIDLRGRQIPSIYDGLAPDLMFANQLKLIAQEAVPEGSAPRIRTLVFRKGKDGECSLRGIAFHGGRASPSSPRPGSCYGQYMEPEYYDCLGCDDGVYYAVFYSTGTNPHHGYEYPGLDVCNGCQLAERACYSP